MFQVEFYETQDGKQPVSEFLDSLDDKMAAKLVSLMELLEAKGPELRCHIQNISEMIFLNYAASLEATLPERYTSFMLGRKLSLPTAL